jgi:heme exporter protein D
MRAKGKDTQMDDESPIGWIVGTFAAIGIFVSYCWLAVNAPAVLYVMFIAAGIMVFGIIFMVALDQKARDERSN